MGRIDLGIAAFAAISLLTVGSAGVVAFARNVIHSVVGLLGTLLGVACLYVLLAADFLAAVQVLVYVGGTLILVLFAVMLTARIDRVADSNEPLARGRAMALGALLLAMLAIVGVRTAWPEVKTTAQVPSTAKLGTISSAPTSRLSSSCPSCSSRR